MTWTPESLSRLATGYWHAQALLAAAELRLFDHLPATAPDLCAAASIDPRVGTMLLDALTALGLLHQNGPTYHLHPTALPYLRSDAPASLLPALRFNAQMYALWAHLPATVRTGQPALPPTSHLGHDPARTRSFVLAMHSRALALLPPVADALPLAHARTLLDVGSGPGTLGRLLADRHPHLRLTLLDLPPITAVAQELTTPHPAAPRITHTPADYLTDNLPPPEATAGGGGYDAITYCGALHQHTPAQAQSLLTKLAQSLRPGGTLHLIDFLTPPSPTTTPPITPPPTADPFPHLFSLNMALISPTSHPHSTSDATTYLTTAGLHPSPPTQAGLYTILPATKP